METVRLLPESDETNVCVSYHGMLDAADYDRNLHQNILSRANEHGYFNLLILYGEDFQGWTPEAAEADFRSICQLADKPRKLAYVNPDKNKVMVMKLTQPILSGETRYFSTDEYDIAMKWLKE